MRKIAAVFLFLFVSGVSGPYVADNGDDFSVKSAKKLLKAFGDKDFKKYFRVMEKLSNGLIETSEDEAYELRRLFRDIESGARMRIIRRIHINRSRVQFLYACLEFDNALIFFKITAVDDLLYGVLWDTDPEKIYGFEYANIFRHENSPEKDRVFRFVKDIYSESYDLYDFYSALVDESVVTTRVKLKKKWKKLELVYMNQHRSYELEDMYEKRYFFVQYRVSGKKRTYTLLCGMSFYKESSRRIHLGAWSCDDEY